jgi:hypothetical protein
MLTLLAFFIGALLGFIGGVLTVRNNLAKAKALNDKAEAVLDSLKK